MNQDKIRKIQDIVLRRWRIGLAAYGVALIAVCIVKYIGLGAMPPYTYELFCIMAVMGNIVFYALFKTNINLRFKDPSLTMAQMIFSTFWGMIPLYFLPSGRLFFQLFYLISFCFGIFQLSKRDYLKVFFTATSLYATVLALEYIQKRPGFSVSIELFQFALFFLILSWFTFFGSYTSNLRSRLKLQKEEIENAHNRIKLESEERRRAMEAHAKVEKQLQLAKKMEAIGTLAGGVAHDLNNILSGIVSYPELLLMDLPEGSPLRKPIATIKKSGHKAAAIVDDLLTMARRGVAVSEVLNLNDIVSEYLGSPVCHRLKQFHPRVEIETSLRSDLCNMSGSPIHLTKTIMNVVSNAAEAMPDGGKLCISTEVRYVDKPIIAYEKIPEGEYITLSVSDTGVGITAEDRDRIFEPFYTKKKMGRSGTGLGLAVVWGSVKDHNGFIDLQSSEGKGTRITLYFPVTRAALTPAHLALPITDYMGNQEHILVVDDVDVQRQVATKMLSALGYSVKALPSGEDAVSYMKHHKADLLVLDMIMDPGMDGLETFQKILAHHPQQKAIITSGFSETDRVKEAQRLGAGIYVKKPFTIEQLGLAVKEAL